MTEAGPGPGWWIASDGRWYPPELHPAFTPPAPPRDPPPYQPPPRRPSGLSRGLIVTVTLVLVVVALGATVLAVSSPDSSPGASKTGPSGFIAPLSGFAGYHWLGDVHQISAEWRVPEIAATSVVGDASTWIGAQGNGDDSPFIQVGVTEDKVGTGDAIYEAFWSDTAVSFHPQSLGDVGPGDLLTASMTRQDQGWLLRLDDETSRTPVTKLIAYGVGDSFTAGEWIQEDPTDSPQAAVDLPYPKTATVSFQKVTVNGGPPRLGRTDGQVLSAADGIILVPTALRHDAFSLTPPTGVDARYLRDAAGLDAALSAYDVEIASWSSLSLATRTFDVEHLTAAYRTNASELQAQPWPPAARADVSLLAARLLRVVDDLRAWTAAGLETTGSAYTTLRSDQEISPVADQLRADLGLPPA